MGDGLLATFDLADCADPGGGRASWQKATINRRLKEDIAAHGRVGRWRSTATRRGRAIAATDMEKDGGAASWAT